MLSGMEQMLARMMGVTPEVLRDITTRATTMISAIAADMKIMRAQLNDIEAYIKNNEVKHDTSTPKLVSIDKKDGTNG